MASMRKLGKTSITVGASVSMSARSGKSRNSSRWVEDFGHRHPILVSTQELIPQKNAPPGPGVRHWTGGTRGRSSYEVFDRLNRFLL